MRKFVHRKKDLDDEFDPMNATERTIEFGKEESSNWSESQEKENENTTNVKKTGLNQSGYKIKIPKHNITTRKTDGDIQQEKEILERKSNQKYTQIENNYEKKKNERNDIARKINEKSKDVEKAKRNLREMQLELQSVMSKKSTDTILKEKFSQMGKFTSQMAHDIRSPLTVIQLQVDYLKLNYGTEEDKIMLNSLEKIESAIGDISHQVTDVLNFLKEGTMQMQKCDIYNIVKSALDAIPMPIDIRIEFEEKHYDVKCDEVKTRSVFQNVLTNAVQAIHEKGEIQIKISGEEDKVLVEIQDSGDGISEENMDLIFEPLFTTREGGTGLGLSNCRQMLENQGAKIFVRNNPTTFGIEFPAYSESQ